MRKLLLVSHEFYQKIKQEHIYYFNKSQQKKKLFKFISFFPNLSKIKKIDLFSNFVPKICFIYVK